ncbi:hypothetical protein EfmAA818_05880 [Enterococcus faecium]|nr:hypothetical protein EfmAA818_05880 [Enterococcus faecium]
MSGGVDSSVTALLLKEQGGKKVFFEKRIPYNDCCANAIQNEKEKRDVYGK